MAVDKPLYEFAPLGEPVDPIAVETELPLIVVDEDDNLIGGEAPEEPPEQIEHKANLAEYMDDSELGTLASKLLSQYQADRTSRADWEETYIKGLDLLGLKFQDMTKPWAGACGVFHPMLTEAVVRFQSQTIQEIFPASGPAKTAVVGKENPDVLKQATRVANFLNYLATKRMKEYRAETERLLFCLCIAGSAFRKVYYDPDLGRPSAMFVPPEDFVVSYGASELTTCERFTHVMRRTPNKVRKAQVAGFYLDIDLPSPTPDEDDIREKINELTGRDPSAEFDGQHTLLEMCVHVDLEGFEDKADGSLTGIALPYVITIDKSSAKILSIYRNWYEDDPHRVPRQHFAHYQYIPGLGFYGFGLSHLIGGLTKSATALLRQLIDAGTLSNLPGGLKTRGLKIKGDDSPIEPGSFRDVDVPMGAIKDNLAFLPYKEPSNVLYQLLGDLVNTGRQFASAADVKASDIDGEAPVGTTLALLEREFKVMSAIQARIHGSMGCELNLLSGVITDFGPDKYPYEEDGDIRQDFNEKVDVIPVSDPNAATMAQRIMQYQAALQLSATAPQLYNLPLLHRQMIETLGLSEAERIIPNPEDMKPLDPVSENMAIITSKPVRAFLYQDHEAHIQTHMSGMQHPQIQQMMAQNPQAAAVQAAMSAHIAEHLAFAYRDKVEMELGVKLPAPNEPLPEDIELRLSRLVAPAAAQVTGKAQKMAQAEKAAAEAKDPVIQQKNRELDIKAADVERKGREAMAKLQAEMEQAYDDKLLKLAELAMQFDDKMDDRDRRDAIEGFKLGLMAVKDATDDGKVNNSG
jgi:hypothetical protein